MKMVEIIKLCIIYILLQKKGPKIMTMGRIEKEGITILIFEMNG